MVGLCAPPHYLGSLLSQTQVISSTRSKRVLSSPYIGGQQLYAEDAGDACRQLCFLRSFLVLAPAILTQLKALATIMPTGAMEEGGNRAVDLGQHHRHFSVDVQRYPGALKQE